VTGRQVRILAAIDDASRESLILRAARSMTGAEVTAQLDRVALFRGYPTFLRMDNGPEFRSAAMAAWATKHGVTLIFIEPGKPFQNCFVESFNGILRRKCHDLNVFHDLAHAQAVVDAFRNEYNHEKPHGSLKGTHSGFCFAAQKGVKR
jgi:putative transposase